MKIILASAFSGSAIRDQLGKPDYSYHFVMDGMRPVLEMLGEVVIVDDPEQQVDAIFDAMPPGEVCVFVCVSPPQMVPTGLRCPTVPLFAWEFDSLPTEQLDDDPRSDWRHVFAEHGRAITLSTHSARLVTQTMGRHFPVVAVPVPVWDQYGRLYRADAAACHRQATALQWRGRVMDSNEDPRLCEMPVWPPALPPVRSLPSPPVVEPEPEPESEPVPEPEPPFEPLPVTTSVAAPRRPGLRARASMSKHLGLEWYRLVLRDLLPAPARKLNSLAGRGVWHAYQSVMPDRVPIAEPLPVIPVSIPDPIPITVPAPVPVTPLPECTLALSGIVYATMLNPQDGRKNWHDIVTAFCWALRDFDDATLVIKMIHHDEAAWRPTLDLLLARLAPFRCRVVAIQGYLEAGQLAALIGSTSFYVNASNAEGLCMPLMEFMSAGKPAIAPSHTAMEDYIDADCAFIVDSSMEHNVWPHDPRDLFRTTRHRIDWHTLMQAYEDSYQVARSDPSRYRAMSSRATATMADFCSIAAICERLAGILGDLQPACETAGVPA